MPSDFPVSKMLEHTGSRISVIIPAYNEAKNLPYVLPNIPLWVHEVILVDGRSADNTIEVAQGLLSEIKVVQQTGKGKGNAIKCGLEASSGDMIVLMDADGSNDPQEIQRFVELLLSGADFAKGSRFIDRDGGSADITYLRKLGNRGLSLIVNLLFRRRFTDLCYGYNAFWKDCIDFFDIDCDGFEVETLISLRACKANLKIAEVPSYEYPRIHGSSNLRALPDGWRVLKTIVREWMTGRSLGGRVGTHSPFRRENLIYDYQAFSEQVDAMQ